MNTEAAGTGSYHRTGTCYCGVYRGSPEYSDASEVTIRSKLYLDTC
jgi:hypothetical protein